MTLRRSDADSAAGPAPTEGRVPGAAPLRAGTLTTIDQVLSSASNALLVFALAQVSSAGSFGAIATLIVLSTTYLGFNRGALGSPILLASNLRREEVAAEAGYAVTWALGTGCVTCASLWIIGWWVHEPGVGLALAISMPAVLAQDVLRFCAIAQGRPHIAVLCDGAWVVFMALLYGFNLLGAGFPAALTIYLWGAAALASALVLGICLDAAPRLTRIWAWWLQYRRARLRFGFVQAMSQAGATLVTFVATIMVGTVAAAGLRGAASAFGPIAMLISALPLVFVPHSRNSGTSLSFQWRLLVKTAVIASALTVAAAALLEIVPSAIGSAVLGETWPHSKPLVVYVALECAAMCWVASVYSLLQARGRSRAVLRVKLFQVITQLTLSLGAGAVFGSALSIAVALAVSGSLTAFVGVAVVISVIRRDGAAPAEAPAGATPVEPDGPVCRARRADQRWPSIDVLDDEERSRSTTSMRR